jgi:hypothetical protein
MQEGIGKRSIWDELRGQSLLGAEEFVERLLPYVGEKRESKEVPKSQRYLGRTSLKELFASAATRTQRNQIMYKQCTITGIVRLSWLTFWGYTTRRSAEPSKAVNSKSKDLTL